MTVDLGTALFLYGKGRRDIDSLTSSAKKAGFGETLKAHSEEEGLALIQERNPDAVFLDTSLNGVSGVETAKNALKSGYVGRIVFLTLYAEYDRKKLERDIGRTVGYLVLPVEEGHIMRYMREVMTLP